MDKYAHLRPARPRSCFTANWTPKLRLTQEQAELVEQEHPDTPAYECSNCGHWHNGHPPRNRQVSA